MARWLAGGALGLLLAQAARAAPGDACSNLLFMYFMGDEALHYASSSDGFAWTVLNNDNPVLRAATPGASIRDPFANRGPDGRYHLVSTNGQNFGGSPTILSWSSSDLVTWENETLLNFTDGFVNASVSVWDTWAPEWHWSPTTGDFMVFAAARGNGFPLPTNCNSGVIPQRFAFWARHTADFQSFTSAPYLLFDPGCNITTAPTGDGGIDGDIVLDEAGQVVMAYKDARGGNETVRGNRLAYSASGLVTGPFLDASESADNIGGTLVEAPQLVNFGGQWLLYQDCSFHPTPPGYPRPPYGVWTTPHLVTPNFTAVPGSCTDTNPALSFPKGATHGSFLCLTDEELAPILAAFPP